MVNTIDHDAQLRATRLNCAAGAYGVFVKRPVNRVTFYRHLRDLQVVRP